MAKEKKRLAKLCTLVRWSLLFFCSRFPLVLSFGCVFILIIHLGSSAILLSCCLPTLVSHPGSPAVLFICYMFALLSYLGSPIVLLSCCVPAPAASTALFLLCLALVFCCRISALLSPLLLFGLLLLLGSLLFRVFKQFLSDKF